MRRSIVHLVIVTICGWAACLWSQQVPTPEDERASRAEVNLPEPPLPPHFSCPFCDMHGANLSGQDLTDVNLEGANLEGANLSSTILKGTVLAGARLQGANLD